MFEAIGDDGLDIGDDHVAVALDADISKLIEDPLDAVDIGRDVDDVAVIAPGGLTRHRVIDLRVL
ncbi:hypothetical protein [Halonotius sp. GCM10025705]|uniref:hypothetical protein n=1 Tax=Halonotius sp. GCM10025705 TaxID=3252678 RepID=UPI00361B126E